MANWNLPTVTSGYINFVSEMNAKFVDAAVMNGTGINLPEGTFIFNRAGVTQGGVFQEWIAGGWVTKILNIEGGGTGSSTAGGARTNLGLGSMAVQNSNAVNITGGSITGVAFDVSALTGIVPLARGGTGSSLVIQPSGYVLMSDGTNLGLYLGHFITALNASNLTTGTVPAARLSGVPTLSGNNTYSGVNTFTGPDDAFVINRSSAAIINLRQPDAAIDFKYFRTFIAAGTWYFQRINDAQTVIYNLFSIQPNGELLANGGQIYNINGSNITGGIIPTARLGSGVANSSTFLRGDGTWAVPPDTVGGGPSGTFVPSGMIALFDTSCPAGWTRYSSLDNRFPMGSSGAGGVGGSSDHSHSFDVTSAGGGSHDHSFGGSFSGSGTGTVSGNTAGASQTRNVQYDPGGSNFDYTPNHDHFFADDVTINTTINIDGRTGAGGDHNHRVAGGTSGANHIPPYFTMVYCRKD